MTTGGWALLCPITRAKNDNKVSGIYLVDGGERNDTAFAASAMTLAMYNCAFRAAGGMEFVDGGK